MSRTAVGLLTESLESPDPRASVDVTEEHAISPVRRCRCVVLEIPDTAQPGDFVHITPGTVTAFVAREGDPLLLALIAAIEAGNKCELNVATAQIAIHAAARSHAFPTFATISYANKTLVGHVHSDDAPRVHVHVFPYNGGCLDTQHFSLIEYCRPGSDTPLICVLLIRQPILTDIEKEALRLAPSTAAANNITAVKPPDDTVQVLVAMTEAAARFVYNEVVNFITMILGSSHLASIPDAVLEREDFQRMLTSLPPEMTAAELLRLRADMLQKPRR
jgi:hypothetical protein